MTTRSCALPDTSLLHWSCLCPCCPLLSVQVQKSLRDCLRVESPLPADKLSMLSEIAQKYNIV